jgi:N4-(beta-N-acetylglucosaminyl)-L-asparaginase
MSNTFTRRAAILSAAAAPLVRAADEQAEAGRARRVVISSANRFDGGVHCCARAMEIIRGGGDTLDAVIAGVNIVELDPRDNSVGYGGLPNEDGVVELDASCMHGPTRRGGAVGALRNIKTPSRVAKAVMEETDHMFLVGEGALRFARAMGFPEEDLLTEDSRIAWVAWKKSLKDASGHSNWGPGLDAPPARKTPGPDAPARKKAEAIRELRRMFPHAAEEVLSAAWEYATHPPHGTINCIALNERGEMSAVTTTSGMAWKIPGRVGDSPVLGGGLWLDQDVGGAGSTGRGEENIRACGAHTCVENMRHGMTPKEAALDALKRVARNFDHDMDRLSQVDLSFYVLRKDGEYCGASLWDRPPRGARAQFAVATDPGGSRHENSVYLLERK